MSEVNWMRNGPKREEDEILIKFQNIFIAKTLRFHLSVFLILAIEVKSG